jgi:isoamylase
MGKNKERDVVVEIHVKGSTMLNPNIPEKLRGTYLGLCHPAMIMFFKNTGITKLQLMPIMDFNDEHHLVDKGLPNYWGYNPTSWNTPTARYATDGGCAKAEVKEMISVLKQNGIKVILDVVYNHVHEDNRKDFPHWGRNYSGCGDTIKVDQCIDSIIESLRLWYCEYGVSGFRFDLATALGREGDGAFNPESYALQAIRKDADLQGAILIAEPWDCETYQLGQFPSGYQECSDGYRQCIRKFWKGSEGAGKLAGFLTGSQSTFRDWHNKKPVNYITYHDGFTLQDLVTYNQPQNLANKEGGADGCKGDDNASWDRYLKGDTPEMTAERREADKRSMMTTLLYSLGEPHILFADLFSHSQGGNNNAYCQDNEVTWINWSFTNKAKLDFYIYLSNELKISSGIMGIFNEAVGKDLKYDWKCYDWDSQKLELAMSTDEYRLNYVIKRGGIMTKFEAVEQEVFA